MQTITFNTVTYVEVSFESVRGNAVAMLDANKKMKWWVEVVVDDVDRLHRDSRAGARNRANQNIARCCEPHARSDDCFR